jgi:SAM-dependent methyltransferase
VEADYTDATYGDRIAEIYDDRHLPPFEADTAGAVRFLRPLAGDGPALELGIGTGRIAIPLALEGTPVHGIEVSEAMVAKLEEKLSAARASPIVDVSVGSFADFSIDTRFSLVYVAYNTFFQLLTQDEQVSCFQAVARHLAPGGVFVMQAFVPDVTRFDVRDQRVEVDTIGVDEVSLDISVHDPFAQRTQGHTVVIKDGSVRLYPVQLRYAYPSELDLMARLAGLRLRERWADWDRTPYPASNWLHVSVWERSATP